MQFRSNERVERDGYLVYALGDEIPASDIDELVRQGHIARVDQPGAVGQAKKPATRKRAATKSKG